MNAYLVSIQHYFLGERMFIVEAKTTQEALDKAR